MVNTTNGPLAVEVFLRLSRSAADERIRQWSRQDSNLRRFDYESSALTD